MNPTIKYLREYYDGVPGELVVNLRITGEGSTGDFFPLDEIRDKPERAEKFLSDHAESSRVCFVPPLCKPGTTKKTKKSGCASLDELADIEFLFIDKDAPTDAPSNWKETELQKLNGFECYSLNDSGGGLHIHYRLDPPVQRDKARAIKNELVANLGGDVGAKSIAQPARIPGTKTKHGGVAKNIRHDPLCDLKVATRGGDEFLESLPLSRTGRELLHNGPEGQESESRRTVLNELILGNCDEDDMHEFLERNDLTTTPKKQRGKIDNERWRQKEIDRARESVGGWLAEMNAEHFVTVQENKTVLCSWVNDPFRKGEQRLKFGPVTGLNAFYANKPVMFRGREVNALEAFIKHPMRREHRDVICDPSKRPGALPSGVFNMWQGMVEARKGDVSVFQEFMREIICNGDADLYEYAVKWLARLVQHPGERGEVSFVMRGGKGTGKGTFAGKIGDIFKGHYRHIFNQLHLTGRFNDHLRDCVLLFGDEVFYAGNKKDEGILKGLITERTLVIEQKNMPVIMVPNMLTIILAANSDWAIPASQDERRYCVANVSSAKAQDHEYFQTVHDVPPSAILAWLLSVDLFDFNHRDVPETEGLQDQKRESFDVFDQWLIDYLDEGQPPRSDEITDFRIVPMKLLFEDYKKKLRETRFIGESPTTMKKFTVRLRVACPGKYPERFGKPMHWVTHDRPESGNGYRFPTLIEWREHVEKEYLRQPMDWTEIIENAADDVSLIDLKTNAFDLQERLRSVPGDSVEAIEKNRSELEAKLAELLSRIAEIQKEPDSGTSY